MTSAAVDPWRSRSRATASHFAPASSGPQLHDPAALHGSESRAAERWGERRPSIVEGGEDPGARGGGIVGGPEVERDGGSLRLNAEPRGAPKQ